MDILLILVLASILVFVAMIISDKKRGLGFLATVLSTCATCGIARDAAEIGDDFVLMIVPMLFILLTSLITVIRVGAE